MGVEGRGDFPPTGPRCDMGQEAHFLNNLRVLPIWGESPPIPWTGPLFSPPKLTGAHTDIEVMDAV